MLSCDHHDHSWKSLRYYVRPVEGGAKDVFLENALAGLFLSERDLRWHHLALVYDPARGVNIYTDGEDVSGKNSAGAFNYDSCRNGGVFYLGGKSTAVDAPFRGCLDEVKVFDKPFNIPQVRAVMRADAGALRVLPEGGAVAVDAGATLEVNGTDESFAALTGAGTLDLASGRLAITSTNTFAGTLAGDGTLVLPAGAELTLGQDPSGFTGYFEMAGGALVLPAGVTSVPATFRPLAHGHGGCLRAVRHHAAQGHSLRRRHGDVAVADGHGHVGDRPGRGGGGQRHGRPRRALDGHEPWREQACALRDCGRRVLLPGLRCRHDGDLPLIASSRAAYFSRVARRPRCARECK